MWKKVEKSRFGGSRVRRTSFAVARNSSNRNNATLIIPQTAYDGQPRATIYADGQRLGFKLGETGPFAVFNASKTGRAMKITIPRQFVDLVPYGTTEAVVTDEGGMLVLDLNQFSTPKALKAAFSRHAQTVAAE